MSPVPSNGPLHTRSTSVHVGGPVSTGNGAKPSSIEAMAGGHGGQRVLAHLDDLRFARPVVDINWSIKRIIQDAETITKQADTHRGFGRLDIALEEYIKASILVGEVIPHHKDYPTLQATGGEWRHAYNNLKTTIQAQHTKFNAVMEAIAEDNARSGVRPKQRTESNMKPTKDRVNGHVRAQSVQTAAEASKYALNGYRSNHISDHIPAKSILTPASAGGSPARKKPPVHPKPDSLHGNSLQTASSNISARSPETDLVARLARLRASPSNRVQDSQIQTNTIPTAESAQPSTQSPTGTRNSTIRPAGPREMPLPPASAPHLSEVTVDVQIPRMPRQPDAIYSPSRNIDSLAGLNLPTSIPHNSSYLGSKSQTSAPPISTVGPSPTTLDSKTDYFSSLHDVDAPGYSKIPSKRQGVVIPNAVTISAEELMKFISLGSQGVRLLVVDLRSRDEFDKGHIMAPSIICVEPIALRDGMSADELGESIVLSPDAEQNLYEQRQDFDLIVFYDQSSTTFRPSGSAYGGNNYLQDFAKAIYDYGYSKKSKQAPMLLLGGLDAWVDLAGPGSLETSSTGTFPSTGSARTTIKPARPLGRVPIARETPKVHALTRRPRESRPLSKEEETRWEESLRDDAGAKASSGDNPDLDEYSYVRTTEDFFRKYPELPSTQESMISTPPSFSTNTRIELAHAMPRPPTRPAPALPRQRSSGISERGPSATYAMSSGTGLGSITRTPVLEGLTGLNTTGVTCYVNAVLQCLSATKGFRDFLIAYNYSPSKLPPRKGKEISDPPQLLTRNLKNVFGSLWCGQYEWITPKTFWGYVNALHAKTQPPISDRNNAFCGSNKQHDAQEFLIFILDLMTDELNFNRNTVPYSQITNTDEQLDARNRLPVLRAAYDQWRLFQSTDNSLVSNIFGGLDMTSNTCQNCRYVSKRWTPFQCLNVNFPPNCHGHAPLANVGLDQLFAHKYGNDELVHGVECQNCKGKVDFVRTDRLSSLPDYLVVNLVRFENTGAALYKVRTHVIFQERDIDMTRFWLEDQSSRPSGNVWRGLQPPFQYDCYAAVAHRGNSILSGHYLAFARSPDKSPNGAGSWHIFNDKEVKSSSWEDIQKHELTILFLKRKGI